MLSFIAGRAGTGKTYTVLRRAVSDAAEYKMTYIIVPEQSTLSYEKQLIEYNAEARRLGVEVLSFTRMVEKVMLVTGGLAGNYIDTIGKTALIYRAVRDCADTLRLFGKCADDPRFAVRIAETVDELKVNGVSPDALLSAADSEVGGTLSDKLRDTALIAQEYERLIGGSFFDPVDKLTALAELLDGYDFFKDTAVYFDGFTGFTPQEEKIIDKIIIQSAECVISLTAPSEKFGEELFYPIAAMAKRFSDCAAENGVALGDTLVLTENRKFGSESMLALERELFSESKALTGGGKITVYSASDAYNEMRFVASEIRRLVAEEGCRYRDIAIVASDLDFYRSAAETELEQYGVPYFIDARRDVRFKPLMRLVSFSMRAAMRGMYYEDMADLAKTGLAGLDTEQSALLENYINLWRISGRKWEKPFTLNPRGFADGMKESDTALLEKINLAREKLAEPLLALKAALSAASTADDYAAAIYAYLEAAGTAETIRTQTADAAAAGEEYDGDRMWELLMDVLDRISSAMGAEPMNAEAYSDLLKLIFENADIGVIPPHSDEVTVGSEGRVRVEHIKYCFIVGATEGNFPRPFGAKGIFTNADKEELLKCSVSLLHDEETRRCELMLSVYNALTIPSDGVTVSYCASETALGFLSASEAVRRIKETFTDCRVLSAKDISLAELCASPASALEVGAPFFEQPETVEQASVCKAMSDTPELAERLGAYRALRENAELPLEPDAAQYVAAKTDELSATKTDTYKRCAFNFFCRYGLSLQPQAEAKLDSLTVGTFIHFLLEKTVKAVTEGVAGDVAQLAQRLADEYIETCLGGAENLPKSFLKSISRTTELIVELVENIKAELEASGYVPVDFEVEIGRGGLRPWRVAVGDGSASDFIGKVDRVDICSRDGKDYLRIIDYKSGSKKKEFSLAKVYDGIDIQMLVYMIAIWLNSGSKYGSEPRPAGVYYFPARRRIVNDGKNFGKDLDNEGALSGIALEDSPVDESHKPPFYTMAQLELLKKHIERLFKDMRSSLESGLVPKTPTVYGASVSCAYCPYKAICGIDTEQAEPRKLGTLKDSEVFEKLREEFGDE